MFPTLWEFKFWRGRQTVKTNNWGMNKGPQHAEAKEEEENI